MTSVISRWNGGGVDLTSHRISSSYKIHPRIGTYKKQHEVGTKMLKRSSRNEDLARYPLTLTKINENGRVAVKAVVNAVAVANLIQTVEVKALSLDLMSERIASIYTLADMNVGDSLGGFLYSAGQQANEAVSDQLSALSFTSLAVIFGAGLVTSLSPCTLSVLPLTLGYIGAFGSGKSRTEVIGNSLAFALGLATTLAILGIAASFAGKAYGQIGQGLPVAASGVAVIMGLNLLEIIELQLPSLFNNFDPRAAASNFPSSIQAYLAGLTFALAASPCSTPVLATLLGYVATSKDPIIGGSLLLTYTTGYVAPLLLAASFAGALQGWTRVLFVRRMASLIYYGRLVHVCIFQQLMLVHFARWLIFMIQYGRPMKLGMVAESVGILSLARFKIRGRFFQRKGECYDTVRYTWKVWLYVYSN